MGLEDEENVPTIPFISTIHRKYGIFLNQNMKDYNLSFGQYPILIRLYDEGPSTQQNLAKIFQLNESTITRALNKLEEKEYIEKHPDYENKRKNCKAKGANQKKSGNGRNYFGGVSNDSVVFAETGAAIGRKHGQTRAAFRAGRKAL